MPETAQGTDKAEKSQCNKAFRLSVAPMMDWTDNITSGQ